MGRRGYPAEFRRKVLDLVAAGRPVARVAAELGISDQTSYTWARQDRIAQGLEPGLSTGEKTELAEARRRIHQLETSVGGHPPGHGADPGGSTLQKSATPQ